MINNTSRGRPQRLNAKSLDSQFMNEMVTGLRCSPFEARAILDKVHEVFEPWFTGGGLPRPGQVQLSVVDAEVPPQVPLHQAAQRLVTLTLYAGPEDNQLREREGVSALRRARVVRMAEEAFQQGGLLTLEDLAALLNCGLRTLVRDLQQLRHQEVIPPLRSTVKDMGRSLTHRRKIVELWLQGHEYSTIAHKTSHSVESVANYVDKFKRCAAAFAQVFDLNTTAFLVGISVALATEFHRLYSEIDPVPHRREELEDFLKKNLAAPPEETL